MTLKRFFALTIAIFAATVSCERRPGTSSETSTGDIVVGMYGSLTGDGASFGQSSVQGAQLAVEDVNNAGGLLGARSPRVPSARNIARP
jgi:branched-chain amino acid transport system substrate-binding protein